MATIEDLAAAVGVPAATLAGLSGLEPGSTERLIGLVRAAEVAEDALVEESLTAAVQALPRPLRGRARALLLEES